MHRLRHLMICLLLATFTLNACSMKPTLPRNMALKTFDPHRKDFVCQYEVNNVPPIDAQAEAWFQEGLRITSRDLPPKQRNYPKAVELWQQAANKKHWKAMMNLAGVLINGDGFAPYEVAADPERAVQIVEQGMQLGIPAAFDLMGSFHQNSAGVTGDMSRAYGLWELAADKGSPSAQTFLGRALDASYDNPQEGFWGNREVGRKMLECAFAQGYGKGALELGLTLNVIDKNYVRALKVFHEGVKMGCEECANYLSSSFRHHDDPLTNNFIDTARSERYGALGDALYHNPDLRFPNLDKILPLPPATLPQWDSKIESLINAAKPVMPAPPPPAATPGANLSGRAHIPQGWVLPKEAVPPAAETSDGRQVTSQYESTTARFSGYWLPQLLSPRTQEHRLWDQNQVPQRYARGEPFADLRAGLTQNDGRIMWHYMGLPQQVPPRALPAQLLGGLWRVAQANPAAMTLCNGAEPCPHSGVWQPTLAAEHPLKSLVNWRWRQAAVVQGQRFPEPDKDWLIAVDSHLVTWQLIEAASA
ncbi:tetratricopeptide repeat protein [Collimonas silvisoli]|uniref:tetratricopeptide repeat protein n=1 Tax=Collimonas silvisoli TaxID=2825884 RepID=UPI001B8C6D31|nr:tetratricopeptide repeat protein [Collimonas silvisoli]